MTTSERTAVFLFNYGGPKSLDEVEPFLFNIFNDPAIIPLPWYMKPFRGALARRISRSRAEESKLSYGAIGGKSPLNEETEKQAAALQESLAAHGAFECFLGMRYAAPRTGDSLRQALDAGFRRFVLLPMYPHFSTTTTTSSRDDFFDAARRQGALREIRVHEVRDYHDHPDFIESVAAPFRDELARLSAPERGRATLLFTAHGLPESIIANGDPYQKQVERSVALTRERLSFEGEVILSYQSKVGKEKWIEPYTDAVVRGLAAKKTRGPVLVHPIAFVSEHQETLYELDIQIGDEARAAGLDYRRLPAPGCRPEFIRCLADVTLRALERPPVGPR
jgi:ferrochelatase